MVLENILRVLGLAVGVLLVGTLGVLLLLNYSLWYVRMRLRRTGRPLHPAWAEVDEMLNRT